MSLHAKAVAHLGFHGVRIKRLYYYVWQPATLQMARCLKERLEPTCLRTSGFTISGLTIIAGWIDHGACAKRFCITEFARVDYELLSFTWDLAGARLWKCTGVHWFGVFVGATGGSQMLRWWSESIMVCFSPRVACVRLIRVMVVVWRDTLGNLVSWYSAPFSVGFHPQGLSMPSIVVELEFFFRKYGC